MEEESSFMSKLLKMEQLLLLHFHTGVWTLFHTGVYIYLFPGIQMFYNVQHFRITVWNYSV